MSPLDHMSPDQLPEPEEPILLTDGDAMPVDAMVSPIQLREAQRQEDPSDKFPVVCLGGSAGSIEGLERFFRNMPADPDMAFVVVTHQSPDQQGELTQVIQYFTPMPVLQAEDGLKVQPNHVYVIPPDRDMSMLHGTLLLFTPTQPRGRRLPIDFFLQNLAKDARERAVCIIFSGLGTDGTIGLKMVMENFGMVMVQAPETAEYDSMPRSAIATEFVDYVLPAEQLPAKLIEYLKIPVMNRPRREVAESASKPAHALQKIFILIRSRTGHDFSFYKRNTVFRRIERRMNSHQIKEFTHYVRYLQENPEEVDLLFKELLIGVTKFFRDQEAYEALKKRLWPVIQEKPIDSTIRVWTPGCSTGEEAYSVAMTLMECLDSVDPLKYLKIQIFATDINPEGIEFARAGVYGENIVADVNQERLQRFFVKVDAGYQIRKEVRDVVIFAVHNLNKDAPFTKLDLLVCRNLLIYLSAELQRNLIPIFHYALNPGAVLLLGPSENLTGYQDLFQPLDVKWKLSRRIEGSSSMARLINFPFALGRLQEVPVHSAHNMNPAARKEGPFASLVQRVLLREFTPPAVVINAKGDVLYINGRTGKYLDPAPGMGSMNLFDMAREDLTYQLSAVVHNALTDRSDAVVENVKVKTEGGVQLLRLTAKYLDEPEQLAGMLLVAFEDMPTPTKVRLGKAGLSSELSRDAVIAALEKELQYTKHRLQTTVEEMESSLEELKSTNEELQSANEELQSTNEEAMTNKEEMQSLNEELMTLNMQYLSKTEELSQAANDMKNLLDATEIATVFLDNELIIKRFTPSMSRIINLLPTDVGRSITHFASNLRHEQLMEDVRLVIDRLVPVETNIQTTRGEWFVMRILPYRTLDNYISGAVITFTEITELKNLEEQLTVSTAMAESIVESVREPMLVLDAQLRILTASHAFTETFAVELDKIKGQPLSELSDGIWNQPALHRKLVQLLQAENQSFDDALLELTPNGQSTRSLRIHGRRITSDGQKTNRLLIGVEEQAPKPAASRPE
ncbi:CheR family methyltransferase [Hymenobacter jejuensis]|uniref:protein-glutamate O-methyltransferase n=1 Tax=Hymenobacter jejuensis TaxID=2502781 RepID=A0A5B8A4B6_9BACT|nr:CheR family methyltransferase [Hymenobacter jejuensis]QDA61556.1 PAS domain-containing protein [Hymenobacter jejuensis]